MNIKRILSSIGIGAGAIIIGLGIQYAVAQQAGTWNPASSTPPYGNVAAPINVGSSAQMKTGILTLENLIAANLTVASGTPTGNPPSYAGDVLTSDANGDAYWAAPAKGVKVYGAIGTDNISIEPNGLNNCSVYSKLCYVPANKNIWADMGTGGTPLSVTIQNTSSTTATYIISFNASVNKCSIIQFRFLEDGTSIAYTAPMDLDVGAPDSGICDYTESPGYIVMAGSPVTFIYPITISDTNPHLISVQWSATSPYDGDTYQYGTLYSRALTVIGGN